MDVNATVTTAASAVVPIISTGGSEVLVQLFLIVITGLLSILGYYGIKWLKTSEYGKRHALETVKLEAFLEQAVVFASGVGEKVVRDYVTKKDLSIKYLNSVDPSIVKKYGDNINTMIKRKAFEMNKEGWIDTDGDGVPDSPPPGATSDKV